jgi:L-lactate dehydrogenase complex protein LldG
VSRESFLARVRDAARQGRAYRVHVGEIPPGTSYVGAAEDLCEALVAEVVAVGGFARLVPDLEAARLALGELLAEYQPASALTWQHPLLDKLGLAKILAARNIRREDYEALAGLDAAERRARILAAGIGISSVDFAIAETGTLVVCAKPGQERMVSLLAPVHVAIVSRPQIVPDLFDVFDRLGALGFENLPGNVAFITGPSKTGDIELQLTTGVHGPGKWHVIVVRGAD